MPETTESKADQLLRGGMQRRRLLQGGLAAGVTFAARRASAQEKVALRFGVWGAAAEIAAFRAVIARYQAANPNVTVNLEIVGNSPQLYQSVDTRLAGRQAPDLFRIQYQAVGRYASARALVDLGKYLPPDYGKAFGPAFWQAVTYRDHTYALPHHTDTFALYYNIDLFQKIGARVPKSLDNSYSWAEFIDIAKRLQKAGTPYGFAMSWQNAAYRWLPFLFQHGGTLLDADLKRPLLSGPKGVEAIAWTQSWFTQKLVPPSTSIKSNEMPQNLFANGTIGMVLAGDWQIPFISQTMTQAKWAVTYMPRDVAMASDLGGNCVGITRDSKHPEIAADFLKFLTDEPNMKDFIESAQFLPVRTALLNQKLNYKLRPDAMAIFNEQATTIPPALVRSVTLPNFSRVNTALGDELDLAFTSGQSPKDTAANIDSKIRAVLGS
jgi:multiple sugar transport system substrate-binding protein